MALAAAVVSVAALWVIQAAADDLRAGGSLGLLAVAAGTAIAGPGLAGADVDLDRTAAIAWPSWRTIHIVVMVAFVIGLVGATALTPEPLSSATRIIRDAIGLGGLVALGAATLGADRAWIPPIAWSLLGWSLHAWLPASGATYRSVLTWVAQPPSTTAATVAAVVLGIAGTAIYAVRGPAASSP